MPLERLHAGNYGPLLTKLPFLKSKIAENKQSFHGFCDLFVVFIHKHTVTFPP